MTLFRSSTLKLVFILIIALCSTYTASIFAHSPSKTVNNLGKSPIKICIGDGNEWAPYTFWAREEGKIDKSHLIGAATKLIEQAISNIGLKYTYSYMPWKRVLYEVEHFGTFGNCEMSWDASFKPQRAKVFYYSAPIYRTHLGVFYSNRQLPEGPHLPTGDAINEYKLCGVQGYNYDRFPIKDKSTMDLSSTDINLNIRRLSKGRCDLMPSSIEPIYGGKVIGAFYLSDDIESKRLPGMHKTFYAFISKTSPRAEQLAAEFNHAIVSLQEQGIAETFFRKYLPEGSGL